MRHRVPQVRLQVVLAVWILAIAETSFSVVVGGDVMLNGISPISNPLSAVTPSFKGADLALANLEVPLTKSRLATVRKTAQEVKRHDQFILKGNPAHLAWLAASGIKAVSLANNHSMDYGPQGLKEESEGLTRFGIKAAGAGINANRAADSAILITASGHRIALLSCLAFMGTKALKKTTPATLTEAGINVLNFQGSVNEVAKAKLRRWITQQRRNSEAVVVAIHWGIEKKAIPTPYQVALGRAMIDSGADLVWGHHPHVLQGAERYRGKPILYSMGNLISGTPAVSGLCQFSWQDHCFHMDKFIPITIRGGKSKPTRGKAVAAADLRFKLLCQMMVKKYPNSKSVSLW